MPKQSRLTGALSLSLAQALVLGLGYLTHMWIGRVLGPAPYGIYGLILSVQTIFGIFLTLGVPAAVARFVAQREENAQAILQQSLRVQSVVAVIMSVLAVATAPVVAFFLHDKTLVPYLLFVAPVIFFQAFYPIYTQFLSGIHRFNRQATLTSIYAVAKLAGAITFIYSFQVYGAFAGFAVGGIIAALFGWHWTKHTGGNKPHHIPLKELLSFAGTYVLMLVGLQILISLDLFMVKALLKNDVSAGYYNAAVTLSRIPYFLLQALSFILLPSVSALTKPGASHDKAATFIRDALRYLIALIVPSVAFGAATSRSLVTLFFSTRFLPAAPVLTVLMVGLGALAFYQLLANIVAGAGKTNVALAITCLLIVISFSTGIMLIPRFGLLGAASATTSAGIIGFALLSAYTFKTFRIPVPVKSTFNIVLATFLAVLPTYIWQPPAYFLPLQYLLLFVIYIACLFALREIQPKDLAQIKGLHPALGRIIP